MAFDTRLKQTAMVKPETLTAHPMHPHTHPERQRKALTEVLETIGWVGRVIVNRTTGYVLDGHERVQQAIDDGSKVPVQYVELSEAEELQILALYDEIGTMSRVDPARVAALVAAIGKKAKGETVRGLLEALADKAEQSTTPLPPAGKTAQEYRCPSCAHEWEGSPKPELENESAAERA